MSEMLKDVPATSQPADLLDCVKRLGQLLRVLVHLVESIRAEANALPQLEVNVQDEFIVALWSKLDALETAATASDGIQAPTISESIIFLARLLQFDLGLPGAWTAKAKDISGKMVLTVFKLTVVSLVIHTSFSA